MPRPPRDLRPHESVRAFFGAELQYWRRLRKHSQDELGRLTLNSGDTISKVEKAVRWPTEQLAQRCDMVLDTGGVLKRLLPLVLAERRATAPDQRPAIDSRRRHPVPAFNPGVVRRPDAHDRIVGDLLAAADLVQPAPVVIGGPGGFGKTTLALQACHDDRVTRCFDTVLWAETGQDCTPARVVQILAGLCEQLDGTRPVLSGPEHAGVHLAEALGERRVLLVVDNVWAADDLAPLLLGGPNCVRLVTTRNLGVCRTRSHVFQVPPMSDDQIRRLLDNTLDNNSPATLDRAESRHLAALCGGWPLLAAVVGAAVAQDVAAGAPPAVAIERVSSALREEGPHALDVWDARQRDGTIGRIMASSLRSLDTNMVVHGGSELGDRYLDLAIFPAAVPIPLPVLGRWWQRQHGWTLGAVRQFARVLAERSLLGSYLAGQDAVVLHDVFRSSLLHLARRPAAEVHKSLIDSFRADAPDGWSGLALDQPYVWRYLTHHLDQAGHPEEVISVLSDPEFVVTKLQQFGHEPLVDDAVALRSAAAVCTRDVDAGDDLAVAQTLVHAAYLTADSNRRDDISSTLLVALGWAGQLDTPAAQTLRSWAGDAFDVQWAAPDPGHGDGHTGAVTSVAAAQAVIVSGGEDGSVRVWDRPSQRLVRVLRGHHGWVYAVAISPAGDLIASAGDDAVIRLWSASTGSPIGVLAGHTKRVHSLAFDRTGTRLVSGGEDGRIVLWSVDPAARVRDFVADGRPTWSVALGNGDRLLAAGGEDTSVRVYDVDTGRLIAEQTGHRDWVRAVAFAADSPLLASGSGDGTVCLWNVTDGRLAMLRSTPTPARVRALTVSPDAGEITAAGEDATARTITAGGITRETPAPADVDWIRALADSAAGDGEAVLGCEDGAVRFLQQGRLIDLAVGRDTVWSTALTPDGTLAVFGRSDGTIEIGSAHPDTTTRSEHTGDTERDAVRRHLDAGRGRVWALHAAAGYLAAACGDGAVRVWDLRDESWSLTLNASADTARSRAWAVAVHPDGETLAASTGTGLVHVWNLRTGELRWECAAHAGRVRTMTFDPTGQRLVTGGGDGAARIWDANTGQQLLEIQSPAGWVRAVAIDHDGTRLAVGLGSGDLSVHHLQQPEPTSLGATPHAGTSHLFGHGGRVLAAAFVGHHDLVTAAADGTVRLWSIDTRQQRAQVRIDASLQCAYVDPRTGSVLASCSSGVVALKLRRAVRPGQAAPQTKGNE